MPARTHFLIFVLLCCLALSVRAPAAERRDRDAILSAAESVFQNMAKASYPPLWSSLTAESRKRILRNVQKSLGKAGFDYSEDLIRADFEKGGEIATGYWRGYLVQFDPKIVLEDSVWNMGEVKKDRADIIIRYKKSSHDAVIQMFREEGVWKVGLEESISTRR